jgi:hypothetical protein
MLSATPVPSLRVTYHNVLPQANPTGRSCGPAKTAFLANASANLIDDAALRLPNRAHSHLPCALREQNGQTELEGFMCHCTAPKSQAAQQSSGGHFRSTVARHRSSLPPLKKSSAWPDFQVRMSDNKSRLGAMDGDRCQLLVVCVQHGEP